MKPMHLRVLFIAVLFPARLTLASDYFIHPAGNDFTGEGSQRSPWATVSQACGQVKEIGDIIHISAGTYTENSRCDLAKGVSILGDGPDRSIIKSSYSDWLIRLESDPLTDGNQVLAHFKIDGQNRALAHGILITGRHNVKIHDITFEEIDSMGLSVGSPLGFLTGIEVYNCQFRNCGKDFRKGSTGCLSISHLEGALIHDIVIRENRGYGIKGGGGDGGWLRNLRIYNCDINVPTYDVAWGADIAIELWNLFDDCEIYNNRSNCWFSLVYGNKGNGTKSVRVHNNIITFDRLDNPKEAFEVGYGLSDVEIYNNYIEGAKRGVAIWGSSNTPQSNILIHHNIFYDSPDGDGVFIQSSGAVYSNIEIYNNVFDSVSSALAIVNNGGTVVNTSMKNNIVIGANNVFAAMGDGAGIVGTAISYNAVANVGEIVAKWGSWTTNTVIENNQLTDPGLVASGQRPDPYYRPVLKSSPVVDAGTYVGFPYTGSAPDIGRYESEDSDGDGAQDQEEWGPDGFDINYDGNQDGVPDSRQANVASFHSQDGLCYATLASPAGTTLSDCRVSEPASAPPLKLSFPYGYFSFVIKGLTRPDVTVTLRLPDGAIPETYYKHGPTSSSPIPHWYEFLYDGRTGAEIKGNIIILHFLDGERGDDMVSQDGMIFDSGGPGIPVSGKVNESSSSGGGSNGGGSNGGGGGCFITSAAWASKVL